MSKNRSSICEIPRVYRADLMNKLMFGFIQGYLAANKEATFKKALDEFVKLYELPPDEWGANSVRFTFRRMHLSYMGINYEKHKKQKHADTLEGREVRKLV